MAQLLKAGEDMSHPAGRAPRADSERREIVRPSRKKPAIARVLVVDDDPLIRWAMTQTLQSAGYEVVEARDARAALGAIAGTGERSFDVILLDYWLPDSDDLTVLTTIRHIAPETAVVLISAHASPEIADQALALGAKSVLYKPFEMSRLVPVIVQAAPPRPA